MRGRLVFQALVAGLSLLAPAVATRGAGDDLESPPAAYRLVLPSLTRDVSPHVTLAALGDVMLGRSVADRIRLDGPSAPFAGVGGALGQADVVVANLECALSDRGAPAPKGFTFRAPPASADALVAGRVSVVSLANNHSLDYGPEGLADTEAALDARGIAHVGAGSNSVHARTPVVLQRNGLRIAFLSYVDVPVEWNGFDTRSWEAAADTPGVAWLTVSQVQADVAAARRRADVVVVFMHFGFENEFVPTEMQRIEAKAAVDAGAALVVGDHSHTIQPVEWYGGGLIAYSLGNFVFDGADNPTTESAILFADLSETGVQSYRLAPVTVDESGFPAVTR